MIIHRLAILGFCLLWMTARAAQLSVGDLVPTISAKDQHGNEFVFTNGTQFLLVVTEMGSAKTANHKLAEQGAGFLEIHHAVYLMDIHTMPGIARMFALPKMRKYPQRIVLVDSAETLAAFPTKPDCVTALAVTPSGRIGKITFWNPGNEPVGGCFRSSPDQP